MEPEKNIDKVTLLALSAEEIKSIFKNASEEELREHNELHLKRVYNRIYQKMSSLKIDQDVLRQPFDYVAWYL